MRLDLLLVKRFPERVRSRSQAQEMISQGLVKIKTPQGSWERPSKKGYDCAEDALIELEKKGEFLWVSRSGDKLFQALQKKKISLKGLRVLDLGQSTGGFTEVALSEGASEVVGIEVGRDQLAVKVKKDKRNTTYESLDVRDMPTELGRQSFDFVVADLSFISVLKAIKPLKEVLAAPAKALFLIKPQFEVGPGKVNRGGIVEDPFLHLDCQKNIVLALEALGARIEDYFPSGLRGKDGNQEFFCYFTL